MHHKPSIRVVSLVPSLTELCIDIGAEVVGRTKFCVFPTDKVEDIMKVGGTKTVNITKVLDLSPDLVLANKEENVKEQVEELQKAGLSVLVTNIVDIDSACVAILEIGKLTHCTEIATDLTKNIAKAYNSLPSIGKTAGYLIWKDPYMASGGSTYINHMMEKVGLVNVFGDKARYPKTSIGELKSLNPDLILLSSEPFPFKEKHINELAKACPSSEVVLVDGTYFSWYGSRLLLAANHLKNLANNLKKGKYSR